MNSRWIAIGVCLLYLGVSTVLAAIHHHHDDGGERQGDSQCAACAWHHQGIVEFPAATIALHRPAMLVIAEQPAHFDFRELCPKIHPSRGPPSSIL